ncbi:hypothetical protein C5O80_37545 [Burkholderia sp. SRS-46]|nr:hypothetical protein C5O80_37545 [Burkholderia sp. SRS-46]
MNALNFISNFGGAIVAFSDQHSEWVFPVFFLVIFCETGLVLTPFIPGGALLLAAGGLAARGDFTLPGIIGLLVPAALLGDSMSFFFGRMLGLGSGIIKPRYLERAQRFQQRYGSKTFVLARPVPIVRGLIPFMAGATGIRYHQFAPANAVGVGVSVAGYCSAGYFAGSIQHLPRWAWVVVASGLLVAVAGTAYRRRRSKPAPAPSARPSASSFKEPYDE